LIAVTGARQTGKSTLLKALLPDYRYVNLDDPALRAQLLSLPAGQVAAAYPSAIWDEVQKAPEFIDKIKAAHDEWPQTRYVLSGSSQIRLLKRVRESLAGRVALVELDPLTVVELGSDGAVDSPPPRTSPLLRLMAAMAHGGDLDVFARDLPPAAELDQHYPQAAAAWDRFVRNGGMPALTADGYTDESRREWLTDYARTYLQRDLADLASLNALEPFVRVQQVLAARSGYPVNFSDVARSASVSSITAKHYLEYLSVSYQVMVLPPWFRNTEKRLTKMPKVVMADPGVHRALLRHYGEPTGHEFESMVTAEVCKQCRAADMDAQWFHLRTADGREVDLLLELPAGFVAIEVKQATSVSMADARHLRDLGALMDKPLLAALLVSNQTRITYHPEHKLLCVPAAYLLG